ncbi:MAG: glutathione peroxidase [Phycisphaerales bacterium JB041]
MARHTLFDLLRLAPLTALLAGCGPAVQQVTTSGGADLLARQQTRLDGANEDLSGYRGRVVMIVNTASRCGYTPQYEGLESLYEQKKDEGLIILGFPSNDFMGQEPGTNEEIAEFCRKNFGVTFPMFQKVKVTGPDADPLFKDLTASAGAPGWNFNKYLLDRQGRVVARFGSSVRPDDPELLTQVDNLLKSSPNSSEPHPG